MPSRRQFITHAATGTAALVAGSALMGLFSRAHAQNAAPIMPQSTQTSGGKWRPPYRFGQGGAPLGGGSMLEVSDAEVLEILDNAWDAGMRYYDTSPWYGLGLSERRFGYSLHRQPRDSYILSTKIGRILTPADAPPETQWANPDSFNYTYDYSASATRRSIEDSLQRLGIPSIDVVFVHDLTPENLKGEYEQHMQEAIKGAMPELTKMREEGIIKAWGMGVNSLPPILRANEAADPDLHLAACQYTLMDHTESLQKLFPDCDKRGISIVVGSPLNNGFLCGRDRYNYSGTIPDGFKEKRARMQQIAKAHDTDLRTAALQFCAAPSTVSSVIPGARKAHQPAENVKSMSVRIPADFWAELKAEKLIDEAAPTPA